MKKILRAVKIAAYPLIFSLLVFNQPIISFAEEITITTYYPSPAGSYNDLSVNRYLDLAVGTQVRVPGAAGTPTTLMTIYSDHIVFNVPVIFNSDITSTGYVRGDLQDRPTGWDVGASLQARIDADDRVYNSVAILALTMGIGTTAAAVAAISGFDWGAGIGFGLLGIAISGLGIAGLIASPDENVVY